METTNVQLTSNQKIPTQNMKTRIKTMEMIPTAKCLKMENAENAIFTIGQMKEFAKKLTDNAMDMTIVLDIVRVVSQDGFWTNKLESATIDRSTC